VNTPPDLSTASDEPVVDTSVIPGTAIVEAPGASTLFATLPFESLKETVSVATSPEMYLALSKLAVIEAGLSAQDRSVGADLITVPSANVNLITTPFCVPAVAAHVCLPTVALKTSVDDVFVARLDESNVTAVTVVPNVAPSAENVPSEVGVAMRVPTVSVATT